MNSNLYVLMVLVIIICVAYFTFKIVFETNRNKIWNANKKTGSLQVVGWTKPCQQKQTLPNGQTQTVTVQYPIVKVLNDEEFENKTTQLHIPELNGKYSQSYAEGTIFEAEYALYKHMGIEVFDVRPIEYKY